MKQLQKNPILILLFINLAIGLMTFRSYGLSWDEPLFYDYGEALKYAYNPVNWFSGEFNVGNSFGSSGSDHANRGPAYLLVAMPAVELLKAIGLDLASAWHLTNFLTFQLGVYLLFRLAQKWMSWESALAVAALFAWQPLLWGHSFINPKDIPFLTFFLGSVYFGVEVVDHLVENRKLHYPKIILASFFLGITTSIRILGPLAAVLIFFYALSYWKSLKKAEVMKALWLYAMMSLTICFASWPYLWTNPLNTFIEVFGFMSDNPTQLNVLFAGNDYSASELPRRYFPVLLGYTLTEPSYFLITLGMVIGFWRSNKQQKLTLAILLFWFGILLAYILLKRPAMYDGYRHFLFILPPLFIFAGFSFEFFFTYLKLGWKKFVFTIALLAFGIAPMLQLHPYQYAYYNNFSGGTSGAFREYETEYWLTCYREAVLEFEQTVPEGGQLFVRREPYIAAYYAGTNITVRDFRTEQKEMKAGDFYLVNTRSNEDLKFLADEPSVVEIARQGALFCAIKEVP